MPCVPVATKLAAACSSGLGTLTTRRQLLQFISQSLCDGVIAAGPPAPVAAAATGNTASGFTANWAASVGATSYRLDVSTLPDFSFLEISNLNVGNVVTYAVTGLLNSGSTYYYRLRAVNAAGTSPNSNVITTFTLISAPTATGATSLNTTSFSANWSASIGATSYRLDVATDIGFASFVPGFNNLNVLNVVTFSVTGLTSNTAYFYRVRAVDANGPSANSNIITTATTFDPATIPNLEIWSRADSGVWQDAGRTVPCTANGDPVYTFDNNGLFVNDWVQATLARRPLYQTSGSNGQPFLRTNASLMQLNHGAVGTPYTVFVVGKFTSISGATPTDGAWYWSTNGRPALSMSAATPDKPYIYNGTNLAGTIALGGVTGQMLAYYDPGAASSLRVNRAVSVTGNANTFVITNPTFAGYSGADFYCNGDYYELMFFSRALTLLEQTNLELYAKNRYNLP